MKRVVLSICNSLVSEAVFFALKKSGFLVNISPSNKADDVSKCCDICFANILVMDVTRSNNCLFEKRKALIEELKGHNNEIKICLLCDNVSDPEIADQIKRIKEEKLIDAFFYESVSTDYMVDVLETI